jgi:hypothetical protein
MHADDAASVFAERDIQIGAPSRVVWDVLSDIGGWPQWDHDVSEARTEGPLEPGTTFEWKAGPGTITSTLESVEPGRELGWIGHTFGIKAMHVWHVEPCDDGTTHVITEESWSGVTPAVFRAASEDSLERAIDRGLKYLKAEAEKRAQGSGMSEASSLGDGGMGDGHAGRPGDTTARPGRPTH